VVLAGASAIGCALWAAVYWLTGSAGLSVKALFAQKPALDAARNLAFALTVKTDGYVLVFLFIAALTAYGSWPRARYFGNTAPLLTALTAVLLFALAPSIRIWDATLGLSFVFIFVGGLAADFLETRFRRQVAVFLVACFVLRAVLTLLALRSWVQNLM
jgi:hypothetical protein